MHWHLFWPETAGELARSNWLTAFYNWSALPEYPELDLPHLVWQSLVLVFAVTKGCCTYNPALWTMRMEFCGSIGLYLGYCMLPGGLGRAGRRAGRGARRRGTGMGHAAAVQLLPTASTALRGNAADPPAARSRAAPRWRGRRRPAAALLLAAGIALGGIPYDIDLGAPGIYGRLYQALAPWVQVAQFAAYRVAALCLVAAVLLWPPLQRLLLTRPSQWLGRVSFMLYLVHVPILCSLGAWLLLRLEPVLGYNATTLVILPVVPRRRARHGWPDRALDPEQRARGPAGATGGRRGAGGAALGLAPRRAGVARGQQEVACRQRAIEQRPGGAVAEIAARSRCCCRSRGWKNSPRRRAARRPGRRFRQASSGRRPGIASEIASAPATVPPDGSKRTDGSR